jgi:serine/threonine-protein kinase
MLLPTSEFPSGARVKLLDFGIAKLGGELVKGKPLTQVGVAIGTPHYMSPEQAAGEVADRRSDLYSSGVILYEMLTGRRPFEAPSTTEIMSLQLTAQPASLRAVAPTAQISEALERVVLRALAKRPHDRFSSANELRAALAAAVGRWPAIAPAAGSLRRLRAPLLAAAALGALLLADYYVWTRPAPATVTPTAPRPSTTEDARAGGRKPSRVGAPAPSPPQERTPLRRAPASRVKRGRIKPPAR